MAKCLASALIAYFPCPQGYKAQKETYSQQSMKPILYRNLESTSKCVFLCIPVHTVGYRVQKFMTSIIILFTPLEEEGMQTYRAERQFTEVTSQYQSEQQEKNPHWKLTCNWASTKYFLFFPLPLRHPFLQHPSNLGCIFVFSFSSRFL